jgi:hypothetical protein
MQKRSRFKQVQSLEERLAEEAKRLREEAELLPTAIGAMRLKRRPARPRPARALAIGCSRPA